MQFLAEIKSVRDEMNIAEKAANGFFGRLIEPRVLLLLARVSNFLAGQNIQAYVVGGFIRDGLLGRATADIDIAVAGDSLEIAPGVATALGGKYVLLDEVNRIGRVILASKEASATSQQWELDFSSLRGSIEQDLAQRDFTIDAMAIELNQLAKGHPDIPVARRQAFSYAIPSDLIIEVGQAVWVPFGDKQLQGIVLELTDNPSVAETRDIAGIIEPRPLLSHSNANITWPKLS
ncbi:unnamed protein product [marine sediment metagenome]|uniref:Poly A polymerase head domain-containing protein n=1 Tax=marine sediment metagenome TaxID=412755 RepID=X1GKF9_9ZZZZ